MTVPNTAVKIKNAVDHWVDMDGNIYCIDKRNNHHGVVRKAQHLVHGYKYCGIVYKTGKVITKRVHRLVAEAFLPNPNNYNIVGHKNNIKSDNRVENLYWTTIQENTQKAVDDGLLKNDKGFDDSQSHPVNMYDTYTNRLINTFGSIRDASRITGIPITTISRQAKYKRPVRKPFYFRYHDDIDCSNLELIGMFDYDTDKLIKVFYNSGNASSQTGISDSTILRQCQNGKPKRKFSPVYFKIINNNKCEETIEIQVEE